MSRVTIFRLFHYAMYHVRDRAFSHKRRRRQVPPKRLYPPTRLQGVTVQKRAIEMILSVNIIPDTGTLDFIFNY
jgi:hypothetical protein